MDASFGRPMNGAVTFQSLETENLEVLQFGKAGLEFLTNFFVVLVDMSLPEISTKPDRSTGWFAGIGGIGYGT